VEFSVSQADGEDQPASPGRKPHELAKTPIKAQEARAANIRHAYLKKQNKRKTLYIVTTFGKI